MEPYKSQQSNNAKQAGINPVEITGNWDKGFVMDKHIISSTLKGENVYGYKDYDTVRTELGELVFQLKYRSKHDNVYKILKMIKPFLDKFEELKEVDIVLPVPSSKERDYQPVEELARVIADYLNVSYTCDVLKKISPQQSKNMDKNAKCIEGSIVRKLDAKKPHTVLLVDDLYSTGATLTECVSALRTDSLLNKVYAVIMTRTK